MGAVKITEADRQFSLCIRERAGWCCERCGSYFPEGPGRRGLHTSHFYGRGSWGVRFHPDNALSICYGCHQHLGSNPSEHEAFYIEKNGQGLLDIVTEMRNSATAGRLAKRSKKEISAHYRKEHARMAALRASGEVGRIEFDNWC